ncbi:hypothetical protein [Mesoterricola sediminis]|uniref:Lipoprotein n=1 Tax=Mesoterricola sediminis TaxID=2927980 RepID=A0AA48KDY8_9BACT|nr:hypothetical protein [Mesoterricola sediminis]BDU77525.1 hypothetical protein METESE_24830 [Mesoterricola sediminis]
MKALLAAGLLLAAAVGCDRAARGERVRPFAPWEAGRTLVYRDPADASGNRLQVRVARTEDRPDGLRVTETFSTLSGQAQSMLRLKDGGAWLVLDASEARVLPAGFPDKVTEWTDRGLVNRVVGRGRPDLPGVTLPDPDAVGVWVESSPVQGEGFRRRTLLLPDLGEVQTLTWRNGRWETTNILISQGFTDEREAVK